MLNQDFRARSILKQPLTYGGAKYREFNWLYRYTPLPLSIIKPRSVPTKLTTKLIKRRNSTGRRKAFFSIQGRRYNKTAGRAHQSRIAFDSIPTIHHSMRLTGAPIKNSNCLGSVINEDSKRNPISGAARPLTRQFFRFKRDIMQLAV
jgi:hypothetical protein